MKRKDFIQKISFIGVGLGLTPWKLLSATNSTQTFVLPQPAVHIPHGNFAAVELEKLIISEVGLECTMQQFLRNGVSISEEDISVLSLRISDQILIVSYTAAGDTFSSGKIDGLNLEIRPSEILLEFNHRQFLLKTC